MVVKYSMQFDNKMIGLFFDGYVGKVYKILPLFEENSSTLSKYIESLIVELHGCQELLREEVEIFNLIVNLEAIKKITTHSKMKQQIFKCTNMISKLSVKYKLMEEGGE